MPCPLRRRGSERGQGVQTLCLLLCVYVCVRDCETRWGKGSVRARAQAVTAAEMPDSQAWRGRGKGLGDFPAPARPLVGLNQARGGGAAAGGRLCLDVLTPPRTGECPHQETFIPFSPASSLQTIPLGESGKGCPQPEWLKFLPTHPPPTECSLI